MTITGVSETRGVAIASKFRTPAELMEHLGVGEDLEEEELMRRVEVLAGVQTASSARVGKIGQSLARRIAGIMRGSSGGVNV